jgi:hypothetical protein
MYDNKVIIAKHLIYNMKTVLACSDFQIISELSPDPPLCLLPRASYKSKDLRCDGAYFKPNSAVNSGKVPPRGLRS